jgi:transcriptional regulator with XRE-family HTH domain
MPSVDRAASRSQRRADNMLRELAREIRDARLMAGASQMSVARVARISRSTVSRVETARFEHLSVREAVVIADAVGLNVSFKAFPGRQPTRDSGHGRKLQWFLGHVGTPLRYGTEVVLPKREGAPEQRAWDAMIFGMDGETGVELEQRLYDVQAQLRRIHLKFRDSGADRLLLLIADTHVNRRVLRTFPDYFADLPRLRTANVLSQLEEGERPPTGHVLI